MTNERIGGLLNREDDILAEATCLSDERSAQMTGECRERASDPPAHPNRRH